MGLIINETTPAPGFEAVPYSVSVKQTTVEKVNAAVNGLVETVVSTSASYAPPGEPGPKGDKGDPGVKGDKGDPGAPGVNSWSAIPDKPSTFAPSAHNHAAADITSGVISRARLGTGTANNLSYLRGDGTWNNPMQAYVDESGFAINEEHIGSNGQPVGKLLMSDGYGGSLWSTAPSGGGSSSIPYSSAIDGNVTVSTPVTLTRDMHYDTLTVASTGTVFNSQYRIYARSIVINAGGSIHADGITPINNAGGSGAGSSNQKPLGRAASGGNGNGGGGTAGSNAFGEAFGGYGGAGGNGTASNGGAGGTATFAASLDGPFGTPTALLNTPTCRIDGRFFMQENNVVKTYVPSGGAGGGSAGAGTASPTQNVPGGGGAGGVLLIVAESIVNNGRISANGGNGLAFSSAGTSGSGGGGGGLVFVTAAKYSGNMPTANGGVGGVHPNEPTRGGQNGGPGRVITCIGEVV